MPDNIGRKETTAGESCALTCRALRLGERRTADPSASLPRHAGAGGMTKGRAVIVIGSSQIGWTEGKQRVAPLRFAPAPLRAGTGWMTSSFKVDDPGDKSIKSRPLLMNNNNARRINIDFPRSFQS